MPGQPPWFFLMALARNSRLIPPDSVVHDWLYEIYGMLLNRAVSPEEKKLATLAAAWGHQQKECFTEKINQSEYKLFKAEDLLQKKVIDRIGRICIETINLENPKEKWITLLEEKDILEIITAVLSVIEN